MTTRRLIVITLGWFVFAVAIATGLMWAISPWVNRIDTYAVAELIWGFVGGVTLLIVLAPLLWLFVRYGPKGTTS